MSDYGDGNFMDMVSHWASPTSPSPGLNPTSDVFLQTNMSEQGSRLADRVAARVGLKIPPLRVDNLNPFALFRSPKPVPFAVKISPGLNPSVLLQSPSQLISPYSFSSDGLPETVENLGDYHDTTTMIFNNKGPHQPMHFDLPPQEVGNPAYVAHVDPIATPLVASFESEVADDTDDESKSEEEDEDYSEDEDTDTDTDEDEDDDSADEPEVKPSSPKRRKYEVSNMMTATRTTKDPGVILRMETEEDHPYDGYRWRKYGQKFIKGNPNPRSYYKCSHKDCNMKKHVEREADNVNILVISYDGIHGHAAPATRSSSSSGPKNHPRSSVPARLGRTPFSSLSAAQELRPFPYPSAWASRDMRPFPHSSAWVPQDMRRPFPYSSASATQDMRPFPSSLNPGVDMTHLYMTGLSKLPSFPANQNHGLMGQNAEPWINQNHEFMVQNNEPWVNQNHGFIGQNDEPKTAHMIPDAWYRGLQGDHGASFG